MSEKFLNQAGLQTLWAQIKAKFVDDTELADALNNYKTSTELVEILSAYVTNEHLDEVVAELQETIGSVYTYKGSVATYADLPTENLQVGDTYNVETADDEHGIAAGDNVAWDGEKWNKLGNTDAGAFATKDYVDTEVAKKTTETITGTNGTAKVWNEASGGGSKFIHNDGTESYVGVSDGGATGMVAQIYADKNVEGNWIGSRLNVYQKGMFYHNAEDKAATEYVADDPNHEIAVKGDIPAALTAEEILAICV